MKAITIVICTLIWVCTLFAIDITVEFSDGSSLKYRGWLGALTRRWSE